MVVHACNPRYSGGRGRRMESLRPAQAKLVEIYRKRERERERERETLKQKISTNLKERHTLRKGTRETER
jgi:molybdenum-dependent DNA-binding transcriptional regulator ModE